MAEVRIITPIDAPIERCFDLARSIDLHVSTMATTGETAIGGVRTGLIGLDQEVTWRARHFGFWQTLTSRITAFDKPHHFRDSMVRGAFASFDHDHLFRVETAMTVMEDVFAFSAPLGILGRVANVLVLKRYMTNLLGNRAQDIKRAAESDAWKQYLDH